MAPHKPDPESEPILDSVVEADTVSDLVEVDVAGVEAVPGDDTEIELDEEEIEVVIDVDVDAGVEADVDGVRPAASIAAPVVRSVPGRPPGVKDEPPPPFDPGERVVLIQNTRSRTGAPIGSYPVGALGTVETVLSLTAIVRFDQARDIKEVVAFTSLETAELLDKKARDAAAAAAAEAGDEGSLLAPRRPTGSNTVVPGHRHTEEAVPWPTPLVPPGQVAAAAAPEAEVQAPPVVARAKPAEPETPSAKKLVEQPVPKKSATAKPVAKSKPAPAAKPVARTQPRAKPVPAKPSAAKKVVTARPVAKSKSATVAKPPAKTQPRAKPAPAKRVGR